MLDANQGPPARLGHSLDCHNFFLYYNINDCTRFMNQMYGFLMFLLFARINRASANEAHCLKVSQKEVGNIISKGRLEIESFNILKLIPILTQD